MALKKRGCLVILAIGTLGLVGVIVAVSFFLPGDIDFGGAPAPAAVPTLPARAPEGVSSVVPDTALVTPPEPAPAPGGWLTYVVPSDILQAELRKAFPIRQNVVDLVRLQLDRPTFLADADPNFLRLRIEVEARVIEGNQSLPGQAVVRTQLAYNAAARKVTLRNAQLVELRFSGDGASVASALQPVLATALAAEMQGYPIYEVPADGLWWLKVGIGFVRDVYVKDGRVAVALGP